MMQKNIMSDNNAFLLTLRNRFFIFLVFGETNLFGLTITQYHEKTHVIHQLYYVLSPENFSEESNF